jgi:hypothetical protein
MTIRKLFCGCLSVCLIATSGLVLAQTPGRVSEKSGSPDSARPGRLDTLLLERQAQADEIKAMLEQGATPEQLAARHAADTVRSETLERELKAQLATRISPMIPTAAIPIIDGASKATKEFLALRTAMQNDMTARLNAMPSGATEEERRGILDAAFKKRPEIEELGKRVADENASGEIPIPPPPVFPADAPPQLRAFLTERHAMLAERIALLNQTRFATSEERDRVIQAWERDNASRSHQLAKAAISLKDK